MLLLFRCQVTSYSFATPWTVAHQAPLSMECSRQEHWSGLPFPSPGDLPNPRISGSPALQADSLCLIHQGNLKLPYNGEESSNHSSLKWVFNYHVHSMQLWVGYSFAPGNSWLSGLRLFQAAALIYFGYDWHVSLFRNIGKGAISV